ncbi:response regulator transcription factor [Paraburkholderia sp. SARCC-3016]|uniref:response regulator transcription factor n=1 Tax=Paraburkholderia sp. SARCC-3016 TaxID=3058611 RepID=UPI002807DEB0|nr:response regulator transcription factor [Paraburkholderia sp. SARCC-3016]MDQ7976872.1 response regulator transcription factor [Paraburkholderia sp. SARCC-3016]
MIRILIADDHAIMREGIKQLFALERDFEVVGEAANSGDVLAALRRTSADLLLLDLSMPGISGVDLIEHIRAHAAAPPILVLSMHSELHFVRYTLKAGAAGYLTKDNQPQTLLAAIRKVAAGGRFIDPQLAEHMVFDAGEALQRAPHERLSAREFAIFRLLVRGLGVNEIAAEFAISNKTVSTHKARLMQKLNCRNNAQLVRYAVSHRLVD